MTMEVEINPEVAEDAEPHERDKIMAHLANNDEICFKSQQRGESDLSRQQKTDIALELFNKSKLNFLLRFGKYLENNHLQFFQQFTENCEESSEIDIVLKDLIVDISEKRNQIQVKNRRYEALKQMIEEDSYFSDVEMMKRNPLLYDQLVGQYLTEDEKKERDRHFINEESTLVKVLMEGIERDNAEIKRKEQENYEDDAMEEEEEDDSGDDKSGSSPLPSYSRWGEFEEDAKVVIRPTKRATPITAQEQMLLKEEFITSMYQNFLDGKDEDFDYGSVDNNDRYDNMDVKGCDEEDKYFDSEEPEIVTDQSPQEVESEDELDIYMSALNQNPAVAKLSEDMQNL